MTRPEPAPQPYLSPCGCVHTTQAVMWHIGLFEKRIKVDVRTMHCEAHRAQYKEAGTEQTSTFLRHCSLCVFYFCMAMIALGGWAWAAIQLWLVTP